MDESQTDADAKGTRSCQKRYFYCKSLPNSVEWLGVICFPDFLPPKKDNFFYNFFLRSFSNFFFIDNVMATHWAANGEKKILKIHSQHRKNLVRPLSLNFFFFFFIRKVLIDSVDRHQSRVGLYRSISTL